MGWTAILSPRWAPGKPALMVLSGAWKERSGVSGAEGLGGPRLGGELPGTPCERGRAGSRRCYVQPSQKLRA